MARTIPGTIVVTFYSDVSQDKIDDFLEERKIHGVSVAQCTKRYAIEVPAGEEDRYADDFLNCNLIQYVNPYYIKGCKVWRNHDMR